MQIERKSFDAGIVLVLRGNVTSIAAPTLDGELSGLVVKGSVVLDLTEVAIITSAALGVLLKCYRIMPKTNKLILANPNADVSEVFEVSGLNKVFEIFADLEQAKEKARQSLG